MSLRITMLISLYFVTYVSIPAHAAKIVKPQNPQKERLVLMPLRVTEADQTLQSTMETALVKGLQQKYEVFSGERVQQKAREIFNRESRSAAKKECDETRCMQGIAEAFQAELIATANVTRQEGGYFLSLNIQNIFDQKVIYSESIPCEGCSAFKVVDKLKELSGTSLQAAVTQPAKSTAEGLIEVKGNTPEANARNEIQRDKAIDKIKILKDCPDCPEMVAVPAGSFDMGSSSGDKDEKPVHRVNINNSFAMSKTEITRGQFTAFVNDTGYVSGHSCHVYTTEWVEVSGKNWRDPGFSQADNHPVTCISWNDAKAYTDWLSRKTGKNYRLPSEAQWEYACRAGGSHTYCGSDDIDSIAWYGRKHGEPTHPVAQKTANAFGLFDMSGNVWEWIEDSYHENYHGAPADGSVWQGDGAKRVLRGRSWSSKARNARATNRSKDDPEKRYNNFGIRIVRVLP